MKCKCSDLGLGLGQRGRVRVGLGRKGEERGVAMPWTISELMCTTS